MVAFVMLEFGSHGCTAAVIADGEGHRYWIRDAREICMLAFHLALELMATEPGNLRLQLHTIDCPLELEASLLVSFEGARRDGRGERAHLTREVERHLIFHQVNAVAGNTQDEIRLYLEGIIHLGTFLDLHLGSEDGERHDLIDYQVIQFNIGGSRGNHKVDPSIRLRDIRDEHRGRRAPHGNTVYPPLNPTRVKPVAVNVPIGPIDGLVEYDYWREWPTLLTS